MSEVETLLAAATAARAHAYCPYSGYAVGAAVLAEDGRVFGGANVENAAFPLGLCAERAAVAAAVSAGVRSLRAVAVVTRDGGSPCGACRQVLREFGADLRVHVAAEGGTARTLTLAELLPESFGPENLRPPRDG